LWPQNQEGTAQQVIDKSKINGKLRKTDPDSDIDLDFDFDTANCRLRLGLSLRGGGLRGEIEE
jgi:hypothetical protein